MESIEDKNIVTVKEMFEGMLSKQTVRVKMPQNGDDIFRWCKSTLQKKKRVKRVKKRKTKKQNEIISFSTWKTQQ